MDLRWTLRATFFGFSSRSSSSLVFLLFLLLLLLCHRCSSVLLRLLERPRSAPLLTPLSCMRTMPATKQWLPRICFITLFSFIGDAGRSLCISCIVFSLRIEGFVLRRRESACVVQYAEFVRMQQRHDRKVYKRLGTYQPALRSYLYAYSGSSFLHFFSFYPAWLFRDIRTHKIYFVFRQPCSPFARCCHFPLPAHAYPSIPVSHTHTHREI